MKFQTLASGSKGNSAIVICDNIKLLIDDGISYLSLKRKLENLSVHKTIHSKDLKMTARNCSSKIVNSTLKYQTVLMAGLQKFF